MSYTGTQQDTELLDIIHGCREGRRTAQERLYKMMYPKMMSMVKRYTNPYQYHLAEEILNNGFLKVFQKIDTYKFEGSFEGWVRRVIYHSIFDYVRQHCKYNEKIVFVERDEVVSGDLAHDMRYDELMGLVQGLSDSTRAVFNMFVMEGLSHKEIGDILGISEGTSKWHLFEARRILKSKVEQLYKS
ncbi:MAG TPA: sigma-70 family RNA polymerase sigma factor [Chitinophagaceae bacterium]|nr:sigma-70 family RNA polymerase sigma factor [Chitinophagaceae bacterium]